MKKLIIALFVLALGAGLSGRAQAATEATTLDVSANVVAACTVSATGVAFPDTTGSNGNVYANGDVAVNCASGVAYNIALDAGLYYTGGWRGVYDSVANYISYALFKDSAYTSEWSDSDYDNTSPYGSSLADTGTGVDQAHTVYGLLVVSESSVPGAYSDVVNVTVYY